MRRLLRELGCDAQWVAERLATECVKGWNEKILSRDRSTPQGVITHRRAPTRSSPIQNPTSRKLEEGDKSGQDSVCDALG